MKYKPEIYKQYLPIIKPSIELSETEIKALLAYLNSTFNWLWLEHMGRRTGGGIIALEVQHARNMPVINVKKLCKEDVEELARLFDELESTAREGSWRSKAEMFKDLKDIFIKIDQKVAEILGIPVDVELLWSFAWEMMERRVQGAKGPTRPGAEITIGVRRERRRRGRRGTTSESPPGIPLDKWLRPEE
ncbi:MAG: hypothetical protein DRJ59_01225 [Thermoprotei archaeon]|nr:MAG: hypothetical protein DRJ59_01225 [Thermoprotei archaeon]